MQWEDSLIQLRSLPAWLRGENAPVSPYLSAGSAHWAVSVVGDVRIVSIGEVVLFLTRIVTQWKP